MGGTEMFQAVQEALRNKVNIMVLTDGEVGQWESNEVEDDLANVCPAQSPRRHHRHRQRGRAHHATHHGGGRPRPAGHPIRRRDGKIHRQHRCRLCQRARRIAGLGSGEMQPLAKALPPGPPHVPWSSGTTVSVTACHASARPRTMQCSCPRSWLMTKAR